MLFSVAALAKRSVASTCRNHRRAAEPDEHQRDQEREDAEAARCALHQTRTTRRDLGPSVTRRINGYTIGVRTAL